ncbi:hypothetical protein V496_04219 [Pseudogymnoascus sp. VKM F-4515 (FW-2607)]|nr:hypothetical protein V496_04219 [Pseudogymnoascus sp. VKM F-4515 (FW-2607)]
MMYTGNEDQANRRTRLSSLLALFKPKPMPLYDVFVPEGYNPIDYSIFLVLRDFLQPDSSVSSVDVAERVVNVFPYKYADLRQLISVFFEIAEQIPYHHPSHLKLVKLMWLVGRSAHHFEKPRQKDSGADTSHYRISEFYGRIADATVDYQFDPGTGDVNPARYVNCQSFLSLIMDAGLWIPTTRPVLYVMSRTFEESHEKETSDIRDAWIMGAAQWILWSGQSLIKLHLDPIGKIRHIGTPLQDIDVIVTTKPITLDMWHTWTVEFQKASESDEFGEECRDVAKRAANLMEALEKAMLK